MTFTASLQGKLRKMRMQNSFMRFGRSVPDADDDEFKIVQEKVIEDGVILD